MASLFEMNAARKLIKRNGSSNGNDEKNRGVSQQIPARGILFNRGTNSPRTQPVLSFPSAGQLLDMKNRE